MIYAVKVSRLTKMYSDTEGIKNAYLRIKQNESIGIIGNNGSGKTTLIETIVNIRKKDKGAVEFFNNNIDNNLEEVLKIIGYLDLNKEELKDKTLEEIIKLHKTMYVGEFREKIEYLRKKLFINFEKKLKNLSSGQLQKFKLLLALYHRPKVVILDEPTTFLDGETIITVKNIIKEMKEEGVNFIISSHDIPFLKDLADTIYKVKDNEIKKIDIPDIDKAYKKIIFKNDGQDIYFKGILKKQITADYIKIIYKGEISYLLKQLAKYEIEDITITEPVYNDFPEINSENVSYD